MPCPAGVQLSDMVKHKIRTPTPQEENEVEDMFERSRVNRRLSMVEGELDVTTQRLKESQKSLEVRTLATAHLDPSLPAHPLICKSIQFLVNHCLCVGEFCIFYTLSTQCTYDVLALLGILECFCVYVYVVLELPTNHALYVCMARDYILLSVSLYTSYYLPPLDSCVWKFLRPIFTTLPSSLPSLCFSVENRRRKQAVEGSTGGVQS